jgi:hypothetical protein
MERPSDPCVHITTDNFRHSPASYLVANGTDAKAVQDAAYSRITGGDHGLESGVAVAEIYARWTAPDLARA